MLILTADSVYELLVQGESSQIIAEQVSSAGTDLFTPPHMAMEVVQRLNVVTISTKGQFERIRSRIDALESLPCSVLPVSAMLDDLRSLVDTSLNLSEALYVAAANSTKAPVLTTKSSFADKISAHCRVICVR